MADTVYLVSAVYHFDGISPIKVFSERGRAASFAHRCAAYEERAPTPPPLDGSDREWDDYSKAFEAWIADHPAPRKFGADKYRISVMDLESD